MGDLTYTEIETEVKKELLDRDDIDTIISNAIQHAQQDISIVFRHYELEEIAITNLIAGYRRYTLPSDLRTIITVRDETAGRRIQKEDYRVFDDQGTFTAGPMTRYARFGNYIEFDHLADSTNQITVRYTKKVSSFSGNETSYLASEWDEAIVLGAIYRVLQRIKEYDQSEVVKQRCIIAGAIGLLIVILFMTIYYRLPGAAAVISIILYGVILYAIFKMIGVTLTLPGIAGLMLSTGFALDANILVFELFKEELRNGRVLKQAYDQAWIRAWPSIRDSNIAALITAAILFWFGSSFGATIVKGFAITLFLGVITSLFSSLFITRSLLAWMLEIFKPEERSYGRWFWL